MANRFRSREASAGYEIGLDTKREAEDAMARALAEQREQPVAKEEKPIPTFREFYSRWHQEVVMRMHGTKTYENSHQHAEYAIRRFGDTPIDQLTPAQLTGEMNWLEDHGGKKTKQYPDGRPLSSTTVRHVEFAAQAALEQAVIWDIIPRNPMKRVKKHKRAKKTGDAPWRIKPD